MLRAAGRAAGPDLRSAARPPAGGAGTDWASGSLLRRGAVVGAGLVYAGTRRRRAAGLRAFGHRPGRGAVVFDGRTSIFAPLGPRLADIGPGFVRSAAACDKIFEISARNFKKILFNCGEMG